MSRILNLTFILSLCGHILGFTFIQPSLGDGSQKSIYFRIFFLGSLFNQREISPIRESINTLVKPALSKHILINLKTQMLNLQDNQREPFYLPPERALFNSGILPLKPIFSPKPQPYFVKKKESSLMFYPYLPYSFLIYFKDRQKVNLEFLFYISKEGDLTSIKRKISCGNLEVDLLVMRHISRSLYLIKESFPLDSWQTVKIELSR